MNYLDELPDYWSKSKSLRRKKWLRVPAKNIQNKTKLFASFPTYCNQKQTKGQEDASWKLPTFYPGRCFRRACSQKSEYWSKCTCSGFATELTLQVTVIFSSPASSCSRSSPACALKPRVHRKPYTISRDPHAISEAHSCWAPPLHTLSPQEVNHLAKFKGLQAGVEAPAALALCHFCCPHGAPPFSNTEGGSSAILLQAPRGWSSLVKLFPSELLRDAGTTSISRSLCACKWTSEGNWFAWGHSSRKSERGPTSKIPPLPCSLNLEFSSQWFMWECSPSSCMSIF